MKFKNLFGKHGMTILGLVCTVGGWIADTKGNTSTVYKLENRVKKLEKLVDELTKKY